MYTIGELERALQVEAAALAPLENILPPDHPDLEISRRNLLWTLVTLEDTDAANALARRLAAGIVEAMQRIALAYGPRQVEERARISTATISALLFLTSKGQLLSESAEGTVDAFALTEYVCAADLEAVSFQPGRHDRLGCLGGIRRGVSLCVPCFRLRDQLRSKHPWCRRFPTPSTLPDPGERRITRVDGEAGQGGR